MNASAILDCYQVSVKAKILKLIAIGFVFATISL